MASVGPRLWPALNLRFPPALRVVPGAEAPGLRHDGAAGAEAADPRQDQDYTPLQELAAALLDDHGPVAIDEATGTPLEWRIFFATVGDRAAAAEALRSALGPSGLTVEPVDIQDEDWAARSQAGLRAIRVDDVVVSPPWDTEGHGGRWRITILPSMGFGTGHHPSTRLCLRALQQRSPAGRTVIDVGTGSGVLAITAAVMGAARVLAVDCDLDAIQTARDGVDRNGCAGRVTVRQASLEDLQETPPADLVLANLTSAPLIRYAHVLERLVAVGGALIISGFTANEETSVRAAFADLTADWRGEEAEWRALTLRTAGVTSEIIPGEQQHR